MAIAGKVGGSSPGLGPGSPRRADPSASAACSPPGERITPMSQDDVPSSPAPPSPPEKRPSSLAPRPYQPPDVELFVRSCRTRVPAWAVPHLSLQGTSEEYHIALTLLQRGCAADGPGVAPLVLLLLESEYSWRYKVDRAIVVTAQAALRHA